jgi:hypothetical protein
MEDRPRRRAAGVVEQDVNGSLRLHVLPGPVPHGRAVREVGHQDAVGLPVRRGRQLGSHLFERGRVAGHEGDRGAVAGHFGCARPADPLGAAADERFESFK